MFPNIFATVTSVEILLSVCLRICLVLINANSMSKYIIYEDTKIMELLNVY